MAVPASTLARNSSAVAGPAQGGLIALLMSMFFAFGFCTVLVDTMVPKFKAMFALNYTEVMLTQFCYFSAYFIFSLPAGWLIGRLGYLRSMVLGLLVMAVGALGFVAASLSGTYTGFLAALFVLAAGVTTVQVAANPATALAGPEAQAPSRLTIAQAFNSLATVLGPLFGAYFILSSLSQPPAGAAGGVLAAYRHHEASAFVLPFVLIAVFLAGLAAVCFRVRSLSPAVAEQGMGALQLLLGRRRLMFGALCIFTYVGAEVSIGSSLANYLMSPGVLAVPALTAGSMVSFYWGGAMVGRFAGAAVLRRAPAGLVLALCAAGACLLAVLSSVSSGWAAAIAVIAVGLCNSIMFPTIFTLAIEGLGTQTPEASGILCLAIVGGALVPVATGYVADQAGLGHALLVPAACYVVIALYGALIWTGRLVAPRALAGSAAQVLG